MTTSHMTPSGNWVTCRAVERACPRLFHLPGMTPAQVRALPEPFLEQLLEAIDPPHVLGGGRRFWQDADGFEHREHDLPALVGNDGLLKIWYLHGNMHRVHGPAYISPIHRAWYYKGSYHRGDDLPAVVDARDDTYIWYDRGARHRIGGPAEVAREQLLWYQHGGLHRPIEAGPAVIKATGQTEYWLHGEFVRHGVGAQPWDKVQQQAFMHEQLVQLGEPLARDVNGLPL